jgi:hypothetical protein
MKRILRAVVKTAGILLVACAGVMAEDAAGGGETQAPPMGPPEEIKQFDVMVGVWDAVGHYKWDPSDTVWTPFRGVARYDWVAGGAALYSGYRQNTMGMEMHGVSLMGYDRELKKYYTTWLDNLSGRVSIYYGDFDGETMIYTGDEIWNGMKYLSRIKIYSPPDMIDRFEWEMLSSFDGGQTWVSTMTATYTKRK